MMFSAFTCFAEIQPDCVSVLLTVRILHNFREKVNIYTVVVKLSVIELFI